jgi:hypothetical protein
MPHANTTPLKNTGISALTLTHGKGYSFKVSGIVHRRPATPPQRKAKMDALFFIVLFAVLIGLFVLLSVMETKTRNGYKNQAKALLKTDDPDPKEVKQTIKCLRLYGGRIFKDKESFQLANELRDKYGHLI